MSKPKERKPNTDEIKKQVKARAAKEKENVIPANKSSQINQSRYSVEDGYWCRIKYSKEGKELPIPLCNFTARITEENIIDDGQDTNHLFTVEGRLFDKIPLQKLDIPAEKFPGLSWVLKWGSRCCLEPSYTVREFIRYAIQRASPNAPVKTHYGHTGWREINGEWVYLHAGGAIGTGPDMPQVSVRLSREIERYSLPLTPFYRQEGAADFLAAEKNGLEASLRLLDIGSRAVTIPLFCLVYLAPLTTLLNPMPNFSFYLFGQSGTFKTTVALLALAHFGNFGGADCLSNFEDTPGILEKRSFILKDTLHVIDDFHPSSNRRAAESKEGIAQRMIRAYSNRTARGRLNSDMSERGRYEPRGMMLMTAEEQPTLESTLARVCIIEVTDGSIERGPLSEVQAAAGKLPYAMAAYIRWVRENMDAIKETFPGRFRELRAKAAADGFHKKLPEQAAYMGFALETAVSFFCEKGAMTQDSAFALVAEGWDIFRQLAKQQQQRIEEDDPVALFFEIISTLLLQGQARLEPLPGHSGERIGAGEQIGWYDASSLFFVADRHMVYGSAALHIRGNTLPIYKNNLFKMLKNRGIIIPAPSGQSSLLVKIGSKPVRVLKVIDRGYMKNQLLQLPIKKMVIYVNYIYHLAGN